MPKLFTKTIKYKKTFAQIQYYPCWIFDEQALITTKSLSQNNLSAKNHRLHWNYHNHVMNQIISFNLLRNVKSILTLSIMAKKDGRYFAYCKSYNISLCVQRDINCFKLYHTSWELTYYDHGLSKGFVIKFHQWPTIFVLMSYAHRSELPFRSICRKKIKVINHIIRFLLRVCVTRTLFNF